MLKIKSERKIVVAKGGDTFQGLDGNVYMVVTTGIDSFDLVNLLNGEIQDMEFENTTVLKYLNEYGFTRVNLNCEVEKIQEPVLDDNNI